MELPNNVIHFFEKQRVVIVSTVDYKGRIHCAAKGIIGLEKSGQVFVIDLYHHNTFKNLSNNATVTITSVDENHFAGFSLQGKAKIVPREEIKGHIIEEWESRIVERISKRIMKSVQKGSTAKNHFESNLPLHPKYLIEVDVDHIINLAPPSNLYEEGA